MGRWKRNASRIRGFHAFPPHGHVMLCRIRALQAWISALSLSCASLWPSTILLARRDQESCLGSWKETARRLMQQYYHVLQLVHCAYVHEAASALEQERRGVLATRWGGQHIMLRAVTSPLRCQVPCLRAEPCDGDMECLQGSQCL